MVTTLRVLLSDGSGLTARQVATRLAADGHVVGVLAPSSLVLCRFTRHVSAVHRVPAYGSDPWRWLEAALDVVDRHRYHVLFPTHEQVAVLSRAADRLAEVGVGCATPPFEALVRVQDKVGATETLAQAALPMPATTVVTDVERLGAIDRFPVYVKAPIGTASNAVCRVAHRSGLTAAMAALAEGDSFGFGGIVVQEALAGPLIMVQSIFDDGRLVAWHVNRRVRQGVDGGAPFKESAHVPVVRDHLEELGAMLRWHGALSLDAILRPDGPHYIDVNPRLVEPVNAWHAGVDLVGGLLALCRGDRPATSPAGTPGIRTHQLLLAVLTASQDRGRRGVLGELLAAARRTGFYRDSLEELTPMRGDPRAAVALTAASLAMLGTPTVYGALARRAVAAYALTPDAWRRIRD